MSAGERWFRRGLELSRAGRYKEALEPLERAMACAVDEPKATYLRQLRSYFGLALATVRNDLVRGRRLCEEAITDAPLEPDLYVNLANVYLKCRRRGLAVESLRTALSINPNHAGATAELDRIGRRRPPVLSVLPRRHPLNKFAGRLRHRWLVRRSATT